MNPRIPNKGTKAQRHKGTEGIGSIHPAALSDDQLLKQCDISFGRSGGPGGQHRNKVETMVRIVHTPTGIEAHAGERRKQYENKKMAIGRLRRKLAVAVRTPGMSVRGNTRYQPSELWESRRQGKHLSINPRHADFPALLAEALDVVVARGCDVAGSAGLLGVSMSQLAKLIRHERQAFTLVNKGREERGLPRLK